MHAKIHHKWDALIAIIATQLVKENKAYPEGHSVANITPNVKQLKDEVGMAGSRSTQTRFVMDNRICYTSLRFFFSIIMHLDVLSSAACGRHSGSCNNGLG